MYKTIDEFFEDATFTEEPHEFHAKFNKAMKSGDFANKQVAKEVATEIITYESMYDHHQRLLGLEQIAAEAAAHLIDRRLTNEEFLEAMNGIPICNEGPFKEVKYYPLMDRTFAETYPAIDRLVDVIIERSHGALKYTYRIGFDIETGKQVAVKFKLDPSKITAVGDREGVTKPIVNSLTIPGGMIKVDGKIVNQRDHLVNQAHEKSVPEVQKTIRRYGHIDHRTSALPVVAIFYRGGRSMQKIRMVGAFSRKLEDIQSEMANDNKLGQEIMDDLVKKYGGMRSVSDVIEHPKFQAELCRRIKRSFSANEIETYEVGKDGGEDKYKTTKLFWDLGKMQSYKLTPRARGYLPGMKEPESKEEDISRRKKYIDSNLNARPPKGKNNVDMPIKGKKNV